MKSPEILIAEGAEVMRRASEFIDGGAFVAGGQIPLPGSPNRELWSIGH